MSLGQSVFFILGLNLIIACGGGGKKNSGGGGAPSPGESPKAGDNQTPQTGDKKPAEGTDKPADGEEEGEGEGEEEASTYSFYMGYDGKTEYSLLLEGDYYSLKDPSAAKLENFEFSPSEAVKAELLASIKAEPKYEVGDESFFSDFFKDKQNGMKVSAIKDGNFVLVDKEFPKDSITVVVTAYTAEDLALGKKRYETDGGGKLKACKSCHETGAENAPPHELGEIMFCSDTQLKRWITTGSTDCYGDEYTARIEHNWEFASDAEVKGVIAYLRSKQADDYETLSKISFKRQVKDFYSFSEEEEE